MDKKIRVLIFPAGEVNSIELHDALATSVNIELYGGSSVDRHGSYIFKNYISNIPFIDDDSFLDKFNRILEKYKIDVIFPTHDTVVTFLTSNQEKINAKIVNSDKRTAALCRDKQKTYQLFSDCHFVPRIYERITEKSDFPIFVKPKIGQGSVDAKKITSNDELEGVDITKYVLCEYLPGEEYTVDCLTDKEGELRVVAPRSRDRTMAGVSVSGRNQQLTNEIQSIATTINERLSFAGLWFFQIKRDKNAQFKLLEVSARCAGTMCLTRVLGVNLPLLSVYIAMGYDIDVVLNDYNVTMDRTLISRYKMDYEFNTVYFDFDDTLIIDGKVHSYSILFLYQCKNANKKVFLITKHAKDIYKTLSEYSIDKSLFTEVIHLEATDRKTININPDKAIFIDNSFQERKLVHDEFKIPVFDVDAIELLLDWRT